MHRLETGVTLSYSFYLTESTVRVNFKAQPSIDIYEKSAFIARIILKTLCYVATGGTWNLPLDFKRLIIDTA
jgi:hypothetical protein